MQAAISPARFNAMKFILIPFFIVHYGIFCFGHLMAINSFFGDPDAQPGAESVMAHFQQRDYWIAVAAIFISHLYSYFVNFIGRGEYQQTSAAQLMHRPYGRIIIMHLTILLGAGLIVYLDSPIAMLLVLIIAKSLIDLRLHRRERDLLEPGLVTA